MGRAVLLMLALAAGGCANQTEPPSPDAGEPIVEDAGMLPDAGMPIRGFTLEQANLAPAAETAENEGHRLTGRLTPTVRVTAESTSHVLRGGLAPMRR